MTEDRNQVICDACDAKVERGEYSSDWYVLLIKRPPAAGVYHFCSMECLATFADGLKKHDPRVQRDPHHE